MPEIKITNLIFLGFNPNESDGIIKKYRTFVRELAPDIICSSDIFQVNTGARPYHLHLQHATVCKIIRDGIIWESKYEGRILSFNTLLEQHTVLVFKVGRQSTFYYDLFKGMTIFIQP